MKLYSENILFLDTILETALMEARNARQFNPVEHTKQKTTQIVRYMKEWNLSGAIVGVSGGIDSSATLALLNHVRKTPESPIEKLVGVSVTDVDNIGSTKQSDSHNAASELCEHFGVEFLSLPCLGDLRKVAVDSLSQGAHIMSPWAVGQLTSYLRTPMLYGACSMITDEGNPAAVFGTTNLSEGGYIGYVGKAADGMTDVQIISDLFKSEVLTMAGFLGVPEHLVTRVPTGDMFDGRSDEELFGFTYDALELFMLNQMGYSNTDLSKNELYNQIVTRIERMHKYNKHKYLHQYPSVFLEVEKSHCPGGWQNERYY